MSEQNQEPETTAVTQLPEESIDFHLLRLDSTPTTTATHFHTPCTACGCSGAASCNFPTISSNNKRRSPDQPTTSLFLDPSSLQDHQIPKKPKKLFLDNPPLQETKETVPISLRGFTKITLPCISPPLLRRCHSDPPTAHHLESFSGFGANANHLTTPPQSPPDNVKMMAGGNSADTNTDSGSGASAGAGATTPASKTPVTASLPPRPPLLRRTVSEPSPDKSLSRTSSSTDYAYAADSIPNYQLMKRMRDYTKEMNQWWDQFLPDQDTGEKHEEENITQHANAKKADLVTDFEEAVNVEKTGECLTVHFKCPCSKGYKILLDGKSCYYRLM
ncbi:uncharacterized protein LOC126667078 [Mercurialis annua]|uniref:uncharacterized protein LOC126667078 n=1 Tax=Mercurialis annua TaxID=3986 RepID=UPI00215E9DC6|nr:uncharacterized protein LOC126667078 [Mercurialis annua]